MSGVKVAGTVLARIPALPEGGAFGFDLSEDEWPLRGIAVRAGDAVHVYLNRCPHAGRPLNFMPGRFFSPDGALLQCHAHGALFEKDTGLCIAGPCVDESLRRLPAKLVGEELILTEDLDLDRLARAPW